jgi:hypothetical protein
MKAIIKPAILQGPIILSNIKTKFMDVPKDVKRKSEWIIAKLVIEIAGMHGIGFLAYAGNEEKIGAALVNTFGESGRELYHEVHGLSKPTKSKLYIDSRYSGQLQERTNIRFGTFMYLARLSGIYRDGYMICYEDDHLLLPFG